MKSKPKIIVVIGQTATGKSDFVVQIAKQVNSEIISADSRQVYIGMDLGTGKITKKEMQGVPHHLLDVASPKSVFTVSKYKKLAEKKIEEIITRGKMPIICGGTGFYIDAVINDTNIPEVPPNKKLRAELAKKSAEQLFKILQKIDKSRAENIDAKNPVRLIRAIEIAKALGKVPPLRTSPQPSPCKVEGGNSNYDVLKIGLAMPDEILKERIHARLLSRIKSGMLREIKDLHAEGVSWKRMNDLGLEYRYVSLYLQNKLSKDEMLEKLNTEIWHYAKRQKTWFKRDKGTVWINPLKNQEKLKALKKAKAFIK